MISPASINDWIEESIGQIDSFFEKTIHDQTKAKVALSLSGDNLSLNKKWGLAQLTFLSRICYIADLNPESLSFSLTERIQSFESNGFYFDAELHKRLLGKKRVLLNTILSRPNIFNKQIVLSETRQAIASLINSDATISQNVKQTIWSDLSESWESKFYNISEVNTPWHYSSHINHLVFLSKYLDHDQYSDIVEAFKQWAKKSRNKHDGTFAKSDLDEKQKIGSTMKILMGLQEINALELGISKALVDFILESDAKNDACELFNTIYILHACNSLEYRKEEISEYACQKAQAWKDYYFEEYGAFSFNLNQAISNFRGYSITKGLNEPDYHGTAMFYWGFYLISDILGLDVKQRLHRPIM